MDWGFLALVSAIVGTLIDPDRYGPAAVVWSIPSFRVDLNLLGWKAAAVPLVIQALLIARSGQSVGKHMLGLRIIRGDGRPAGVFQGFVMRELPFRALTFVAGLAPLLGAGRRLGAGVAALSMVINLLDDACILGAERRCLHDRIAGTRVVAMPRSPR